MFSVARKSGSKGNQMELVAMNISCPMALAYGRSMLR